MSSIKESQDDFNTISSLKTSENETFKLDLSFNNAITTTEKALIAVDSIKEELCKVPVNPCEKQYFDSSISPLLLTIDSLSRISVNLSTSVSLLTTSPIVPRKKSKLKDTIHLIYDINEECENIYDILKKRVETLIDDD